MEPKTITIKVPALPRNWRTSLSWGITGLAWIAGHQTEILPHVPPKYQPLAGAVFGLGVIISGLLTKDAGNHAPPTLPGASSLIIDPTVPPAGGVS